jgi:hypothetical protein
MDSTRSFYRQNFAEYGGHKYCISLWANSDAFSRTSLDKMNAGIATISSFWFIDFNRFSSAIIDKVENLVVNISSSESYQ